MHKKLKTFSDELSKSEEKRKKRSDLIFVNHRNFGVEMQRRLIAISDELSKSEKKERKKKSDLKFLKHRNFDDEMQKRLKSHFVGIIKI